MGATKHLGFVGTGLMGAPIVGHLLDAGYTVTVHNRTKEHARSVLDAGATWSDTPAGVCDGADAVFTMVGYPTDVEEVYLGPNGLLGAARPGTYLVDLTTSSPELAREIHEAAESMDLHAFDCPVTGGESGAKAGTLTLIAGSTEADAAPVVDALKAFGSKIYWFGKAGAGQQAKLCNQLSLAGSMIGMAEAIAFARQSGLDVAEMVEMVSGGMGASRALSTFAPQIAEGDWRPGFKVQHLAKDIALALEAADEDGLSLPGAETALMLYDTLARIGGANLGTQVLEVLYEEEADAVAAGLDWSLVQGDGHHDHEHCDHDHGDGCCGGHHHDDGHECCGGHGHGHDGCCGGGHGGR